MASRIPRTDDFPSALLFDSGGGWLENRAGGCVIFGKPDFTISSGNTGSFVISGDRSRKIKRDPVCEMEKKISEGYSAVGFFGYEYLKETDDGGFFCEKKRAGKNGGSFEFPIFNFHFYKNNSNAIKKETVAGVRNLIRNSKNRFGKFSPPNFSAELSSEKSRFVKMVKKIKSHIKAGDIYQVNISRAREFSSPGNPADFFLHLFDFQPVPFAAYMNFGTFQFLSGSMEMFLKKTGNKIISRPIKGTARRGKSSAEDSEMRKKLAENEKEKSEILMITDLVRNDLSRICVPSSVKTRRIFNIKSYKTLFHMESEVEGVLKKNISISEIIKKTFPPASVTGAPKTKAIEIISRLEPHSRGPYCGAAGIFYPNGNFCLNVSIRCLQISARRGICWSGAGIVWDSIPEKEFEETELKLHAQENAGQTYN